MAAKRSLARVAGLDVDVLSRLESYNFCTAEDVLTHSSLDLVELLDISLPAAERVVMAVAKNVCPKPTTARAPLLSRAATHATGGCGTRRRRIRSRSRSSSGRRRRAGASSAAAAAAAAARVASGEHAAPSSLSSSGGGGPAFVRRTSWRWSAWGRDAHGFHQRARRPRRCRQDPDVPHSRSPLPRPCPRAGSAVASSSSTPSKSSAAFD